MTLTLFHLRCFSSSNLSYIKVVCLFLFISLFFSNPINSQSTNNKNPSENSSKQQVQQAPQKDTTQIDDVLEKNFQLLERELTEETSNNTNTSKKEEPISWTWQIIKTTIILFILLGLFILFWRFRIFKKGFQKPLSSNLINILHERNIKTGQSLQVLEFNSQILLLGISDGAGIQILDKIQDKLAIDQIKLLCSEENTKENTDFLTEMTVLLKNRFHNFFNPISNNSSNSHPNQQTTQNNQPLETDTPDLEVLRHQTRKKIAELRKTNNDLKQDNHDNTQS